MLICVVKECKKNQNELSWFLVIKSLAKTGIDSVNHSPEPLEPLPVIAMHK